MWEWIGVRIEWVFSTLGLWKTKLIFPRFPNGGKVNPFVILLLLCQEMDIALVSWDRNYCSQLYHLDVECSEYNRKSNQIYWLVVLKRPKMKLDPLYLGGQNLIFFLFPLFNKLCFHGVVPLWLQCVCQHLKLYVLLSSNPEVGKESASIEAVGQGSWQFLLHRHLWQSEAYWTRFLSSIFKLHRITKKTSYIKIQLSKYFFKLWDSNMCFCVK